MASLNHVCIWSKEDNCWKPITVEQASKMYPTGTVSVHSGLFMCGCCRQYVTLTHGKKQARAFKHSRGESDKSCPERTMGPDYKYSFGAGEHVLPIRMTSVSPSGFSIEIGFIYVPSEIIEKYKGSRIEIRPDNTEKPFVYLFERLNSDSITYLPVGSNPAAKYKINSTGELSEFWPSEMEGIQYKGRLFDGQTGKMLAVDADVVTNHLYYLLCVTNPYYKYPDIEINKICEKQVSRLSWKIFEIRAVNYSEDAAKFFLEYRCLLTEQPIRMQVMWPVYIKKPYSVIHNHNYLIWHINGGEDISLQVYPPGKGSHRVIDEGDYGKTVCVDCSEDNKIVSVGRHTPLEYAYVWKRQLDEDCSYKDISIENIDGDVIEDQVQNVLPRKNVVVVTSAFDGTVIVERKAKVIDELTIIAGNRIEIGEITYGKTIKVYQGLDLCRVISFVRPVEEKEEANIIRTLESFGGETMDIPVRMVENRALRNYPEIRKWIARRIRKGNVSCKAYKYLRKLITEGTL